MIVVKFFIYFIIYAFIGWCLEVIDKYIEFKRFVNRGFLIGPICPIYGYGVLGIVLLIGSNNEDILAVFLKSILVCSVLEYLTSYAMEKIFKARWWDYSKNKFNINGRICLNTMIPFGILGTLVILVIHPLIVNFVNIFTPNVQLILAIILFTIYLVDNVISYTVLHKIRSEINMTMEDNTEIIREKVLNFLENNSVLFRRFKSAYPNFIIRIEEIKKNVEIKEKEIKRKIKKIKSK